MADNDIYFTTGAGTRILMKTNNELKGSFAMEFIVNVFDNPAVYDIEGKRIVLCYTGGDQEGVDPSSSNIGIGVFAEKKTGEDIKLTIMYCEGATYWVDWFDQHGFTKVVLDPTKWYHVVFSYRNVDTDPGADLYVTEGPKRIAPSVADYSFSATMPAINRSSVQFGFGSTNEGLSGLALSGIGTNGDTLTTEVAQNIAMNFLRLWDNTLITNTSIPYNIADLFLLAYNRVVIDMTTAADYGDQPPDKYPLFFIESGNVQTLMFQASSKGISSLNDILNSAHHFQIGTEPFGAGDDPDGVGTIPNVTDNPSSTDYPPLESFAISSSAVTFTTESAIGGDPHIYPLIGDKYDLHILKPYRLFSIKYGKIKVVCNGLNVQLDDKKHHVHVNQIYISICDKKTKI